MNKKIAPPSATGPAGHIFEAKVGALYMLAMLKGAAAHGLPDSRIERIALQGAPDGNSLDDVVVHGRLPDGAPATLEVQVKRDIAFSPKDPVFRDVVEQIVDVIKRPGFATERHELAVATGKITGVVSGPYQEVLSRARSHASAETFFKHLRQAGLASDGMRTFVETLRGHLNDFGAQNDDESVWLVLRRFQIIYFDFIAPGSTDESLARDRCADILHAQTKDQAANFWDALVLRCAQISADGGDATAASLTDYFKGRFRFEGDSRYHLVRAAVAAASDLALKDVATTVLGVTLSRSAQMDAIRTAISTKYRFVEIRGDAGVGKSALLKRLALEVARESRVLAVAPGRIPSGGWDAMRSRLNFEGGAEDFLRDLASDGGGWLFVDNLDFYTAAERSTINDLLRAASRVAGFVVIATARARFGLDEGSWLDGDALAALGKAMPVHVEPIDDDELEQLRNAEPRLYALLAPDHPANAVTRNLYLLSRLLTLPEGDTQRRTEIEMATIWWKNGGGDPRDATARARGRVLRDLGERATRGDITFDVTALDAAALDALIGAEVLSDFGNDRVAFRHDVLREWAVANVIANEASKIALLPLEVLGSPVQLRGVELAARVTVEEARSPAAWRQMLEALSGAGSHTVWRRAVILALVHTEAPKKSIALMGDTLLADNAAILRELVPIMTAVDVRPARDLPIPGVDPEAIPEGFNIPSGPAWPHLIVWVLSQGSSFPHKALPEVVELCISWCSLGLLVPGETLTPLVLRQFKLWLVEIESANDWTDWRDRQTHTPAFKGAIDEERLTRIESDMRVYLALLAARVPDVAKSYLTHVKSLKCRADIYGKLMKSSGTLAQAAPEELAAITLDYLRKTAGEDGDDEFGSGRRRFDGALAHADKDFLPAAPSQGPFYGLLKSAPPVGLKLIRTLVDEVVAFHADGKEPGDNDVLVIDMPSGIRRFPWIDTYLWSDHSGYYSITSALMALLAWAHERIESGEDIAAVIADIVGEGDAPAAYILLAVHIIISHWPQSAAAGVPFVGCPELLSLDLQRPIRMAASGIDFLGFGRLSKEPVNGPRLASLTQRVSRRVSLDDLLGRYALLDGGDNERAALKNVLESAHQRLGEYQPDDDRSDPRLMAYLALNTINPANWVEEVQGGVTGHRYTPPVAEVAHFQPLQARVIANNDSLQYTTAISRLIDDTSKASVQNADAIAAWVEKQSTGDGELPEPIDQAMLGAALIVMRDGTAELRAAKREWAEMQFARAWTREPDIGGRVRQGMLFNPVAIAFAGRIFALRDQMPTRNDYELVLHMVAGDAAAARGAVASTNSLDALDARLRPSILRVAFTAAFYFWHPWDTPDDAKRAADDEQKTAVEQAIMAEVNWLVGQGAEPAWPTFDEGEIRGRGRRRGVRIGVPRVPERPPREVSRRFVNHQEAALWLSALASRAEGDKAWMEAVETTYAPWTFAANGAGLQEDQEIEAPQEWNAAFFSLMTANFRGKKINEIESALEPLFKLQDEAFFDLTEIVLYKVDALYFNEGAIATDTAVEIRKHFALRLSQSYGFQRLRTDKSTGVEVHLGPAIATVFFNLRGFGEPPRLYLPAGLIQRSLPFLPVLEPLAEQAPGVFVAMCAMNWVEAAPTTEHLRFVVSFATAAITARPDDKVFWSDYGIAARICNWLTRRLDADETLFGTTSPERRAIDELLAKFVTMGISEARRLEIRLQATS